jgi:protein associated with RNAse G/E
VTKCGVPHGSILGPLFFLFYINDLPKIVNKDNNMVLFAGDTSIIITDSNKPDFNININQTFQDINTWFNVNLLTLNVSKTQYLEFRNKNYYNVITQINYGQKCVFNTTETKFLGLIIDDTDLETAYRTAS